MFTYIFFTKATIFTWYLFFCSCLYNECYNKQRKLEYNVIFPANNVKYLLDDCRKYVTLLYHYRTIKMYQVWLPCNVKNWNFVNFKNRMLIFRLYVYLKHCCGRRHLTFIQCDMGMSADYLKIVQKLKIPLDSCVLCSQVQRLLMVCVRDR